MNSRSLRPWLALLAVPMLAFVASCSSDDGDEEGSTGSTTTADAAAGDGPCPSPGISTEDLDLSAPGVAAPGEAVPFTADPSLRGRTVTLYTGRDEELIQPLIDRFSEQTGVTVDVRYGSSAEMGAQILEEGAGSPADLFYSQEVGAVGALAKEGLLSPLPDEIVERVQERFRPGHDSSWVGVTGRSRVIAYNPEAVDEVPQCVAALTDPAYADEVAIVPGNAGFQAFVTGFRVGEGDAAAREWLEEMQANGVVTDIESNGDVLDAVDAGDVAIGLINHYYWARHENRDGLTAQLVFPTGDDPGGLVNATAVGVTAKGAENPAAMALVDYLTSAEGQEYFVSETWEYPVVGGVVGPQGLPPLAELEGPQIDLADLDSLAETQALLGELGLDVS
jgi:iron(III) transport system substrate-binding protein